MYSVYILYSKSTNQYYIGYTADSLESRLRKHNSIHKGFTGRFNDWQIVHCEQYSSKVEALEREKYIKNRKSRTFLEQLISE